MQPAALYLRAAESESEPIDRGVCILHRNPTCPCWSRSRSPGASIVFFSFHADDKSKVEQTTSTGCIQRARTPLLRFFSPMFCPLVLSTGFSSVGYRGRGRGRMAPVWLGDGVTNQVASASPPRHKNSSWARRMNPPGGIHFTLVESGNSWAFDALPCPPSLPLTGLPFWSFVCLATRVNSRGHEPRIAGVAASRIPSY